MFKDWEPKVETIQHLHETVIHVLREVYPVENCDEFKEAEPAFTWIKEVEEWLLKAKISIEVQKRIGKSLSGARKWVKSWRSVQPQKADFVFQKQLKRVPQSILKDIIYLLNVSSGLDEEYSKIMSAGKELILLGQEAQ